MMTNSMNLNDLTLDYGASVLDCLKKLENIESKTVFLTSNNKLVGSITDGDIRRWIVSGGSLDSSLNLICNLNPITLKSNEKPRALALMSKHNINSIPIIDDFGQILEVIINNERNKTYKTTKAHKFPVIIQAGGLGTRLKPMTNVIPKALFPVNGIPITETIIDLFESFGVSDFTLITNYKKNIIKAYFEETKYHDVINYLEEETPLGTIGGLSLLGNAVNTDFVLTYCDTIIDLDYNSLMEFHKKNQNDLTIVSIVREEKNEYGIIKTDDQGRFLLIAEKPIDSHMINSGLFVFSPNVFKLLDSNIKMDSLKLIQLMQEASMTIGYFPVSESSWYDFGNLKSIESNSKRILNSPLRGLYSEVL